MNHHWRQQWIIWTSKYFTVIDHYRLREIRATDAAAFCVFYNKALGAESKAHFQPLGQQTDDTTCMRIASGSAGQSYSHRMDLVITSASSAIVKDVSWVGRFGL